MASDDIQLLRTLLTEHGSHMTRAREATFQLLVSPEPQSIAEILARARALETPIDRVSVYRNIELFEKLGIAHRIYVGWKYKIELSDQFVRHHHHLSCLSCGTVIDIEDETHIDDFIRTVADRFGFTPRRHQFEVDGYCSNCQTQKNIS